MKRKSRSARQNQRPLSLESFEVRSYLAAHIMGSSTSYATIQAAVDAAAPKATITVDAGTYNETVVIGKSVTLLGAQAGHDARSTRTGGETIVNASQTVFKIIANDVTIDGFTVNGTKAAIGAGQGAGILMGPSIHGTHVVNNIIENNVTGLYLSNDSDTDAAIIQHNYFYNNYETGSDWTYGWNGSRQIYSDGEVSGGLLTNVLIDSNLFKKDANGTGEGMIALAAQSQGKQFNITISNNIFTSNYTSSKALIAFNTTNLSFIGNDVSGQNDSSSGPVRFEGGNNNVNIEYNNIHDNYGPGVAVDNAGVPYDSSGFFVEYNNFTNNGTHANNIGVITNSSEGYDGPTYVANNWWGNASGPSGLGKGTGEAVWGNGKSGHYTTPSGSAGGTVIFSPWATTPINLTNIPAPSVPTGLTAAGASSTSIALTWTAPYSTATSQQILRSTDGTHFTLVATVSPLLNTYTDSGLASGQKYYYTIVAVGTNTVSSQSVYASATPPVYQPPSPPTGLSVTSAASTSISLQWSAPANAFNITGYTIYRNGVAVGVVNGTTFTDTGLTASTTYTYSVATNDSTGAQSSASNLIAASTSLVQFADPGFESSGTTTYVYDPTNTPWTFGSYSGIETNGSSFGAANAPQGTHGAFLQSTGSQLGYVTQSLAISLPGTYTISFSAAQRSGNAVQPIAVSIDGVLVGTISPTSTAFASYTTASFALTAGTHLFKFAATKTGGDYSSFIDAVGLNLVSASVAPAAPLNVSAIGVSATQSQLAWLAPGIAPSSYTLLRSTDNVNFTSVATGIAGTATSYTDANGLSAGTTYYYRLVAVNSAGSSAASNTAIATTLSAAATTTNLSTLPWTSATAGWKTPQINSSVADNTITLRGKTYASGIGTHALSTINYNLGGKYTVFKSDVGIDDEVIASGTGAVDFQVYGDGVLLFDSGVLTRTSPTMSIAVSVKGVQTLTLVASNGVPNSIDYDHADWAGAQLLANPLAPAAPTGVTASGASTSSIQLAWLAGDASQTGFVIDRSIDGGATWNTIASVAANVLSYADNGLTSGVTYSYRVRASNSGGTSANSAVVSSMTLAANSVVTPISSLTWTSATASWGTVTKNASVKGNTITLRGQTYSSGLGTNTTSNVTYAVNGKYTTFQSDIGIDDEVGANTGQAIFQVIGDGKVLYTSGLLTNASSVVSISVDITGVQTLTLVAATGPDGSIDYAHADWAGAQLLGAPQLPAAPTNVIAATQSSAAIKVVWDADGSQTGFALDRSSDGGATWSTIATVGGSVLGYTDSNLAAGTTYSYRVRETNAVGASADSAVVSATTLAAVMPTTLSSLNWVSATSGWGNVTKDASVKGNTLTLGGQTYTSGIGVNTSSQIVFNLNGKYTNFLSDIGIDDEENGIGTGSAIFQVIGDGKVLYTSSLLTNGTAPTSINVDVTGVQTLTLVAMPDASGNIDYAHADWAGARLV